MTNAKVAIGIFLLLLALTFGLALNTFEKIVGLPAGKYLEKIKDYLFGFLEDKGFAAGEIAFKLESQKTDLQLNPFNPVNITITGSSLYLEVGDVMINSTNVNVSISDFDGDVTYENGKIELEGDCQGITIDKTKLTKKSGSIKLVSEVSVLKIEGVQISSLSLEPVEGTLALENMTININREEVQISSFDGNIEIKEKIKLSGTCSQINTGGRIIK